MIYFTDEIIIISVTKDKAGAITEVENDAISANVFIKSRLISNSMGQEVWGAASIMIDSSNTVKYGDKIKINKLKNVDYVLKNKKFIIHSISPSGMGAFIQDLWRIEI